MGNGDVCDPGTITSAGAHQPANDAVKTRQMPADSTKCNPDNPLVTSAINPPRHIAFGRSYLICTNGEDVKMLRATRHRCG